MGEERNKGSWGDREIGRKGWGRGENVRDWGRQRNEFIGKEGLGIGEGRRELGVGEIGRKGCVVGEKILGKGKYWECVYR